MARYQFRPVTEADQPLLLTWRREPHVLAWWEAPESAAPEEEDPRVARWIVSLEGRPFAYLQDYTPHGWEGHHFGHLPPGTRGIDQYIGDPGLIGRGHGPVLIRARCADLFAAGAPVVATDPHPENARAIRAYEKAGFQASGPPRETEWGLILPMICERPGG